MFKNEIPKFSEILEKFEEIKSSNLNEGTNNFYTKNASKTYSPEWSHDIEDEWEYDDIKYSLKTEFKSVFGSDFTPGNNKDFEESLRDYPGLILGEIKKTERIAVGDEEEIIQIILCPIIRGGYYSGFNLDWKIELETNYETEFVTVEEAIEDIRTNMKYYETYDKNSEIILRKLEENTKKTFEDLIYDLEKIYEEFCKTNNNNQ